MAGPATKRKVFAYITHASRLLVFQHTQFPEAGIQVPAGTVGEGEEPDTAVLREAFEETGLAGLELDVLLGETVGVASDAGLDEVHHRYYYHLRYTGDPPRVWRHWECDASDGSPPLEFELFWAPLPGGLPQLLPAHAAMLPKLLARLAL
jgi:8-oxo-dGTP pyrophosphatase MutT (NUDIX family)